MNTPLTPSFGRRKARKLRFHSQKAYDDILPLVKLDITKDFFEPEPSEAWLEIGFGGGEHLLAQLAANPSVHMIGCEPFMNGIANVLAHLDVSEYPRVRIWPEDVRYLLPNCPSAYFSRAFILFPDPWPKKRQQRRRLIAPEFIDLLSRVLKPGALLHIASDDVSYVQQIQDVLYPHPGFSLKDGPPSADPLTWGPHPLGWPFTRYEQKALAKGKPSAYMVFSRIREQILS